MKPMTVRAKATTAALFTIFWIAAEAQSQVSTPLATATPTPIATETMPLATESPSVTPTTDPAETPTTATPVEEATPTPAATPSLEPTVAPPAGPPTLGGRVEVLSTDDSQGTEGDVLTSGRFAIENTSDTDELVTEVEIDASDPSIVSSFTLEATLPDGSSQTSTSGDPDSTNVFRFDPGLVIPAGETATFELRATIGDGGSGSATATPEATTTASETTTPEPTTTASGTVTVTPEATATVSGTATATPEVSPTSTAASTTTPVATTTAAPTGSPTPTATEQIVTLHDRGPDLILASARPGSGPVRSGQSPLAFATLFLAVASPAFRYGRRLKTARTLAWLLALAFLATKSLTGCGLEDTSSQTVKAVRGSSANGPVFFDGVPASVGSVSRPAVLAFPGAASDGDDGDDDADPTATPTP